MHVMTQTKNLLPAQAAGYNVHLYIHIIMEECVVDNRDGQWKTLSPDRAPALITMGIMHNTQGLIIPPRISVSSIPYSCPCDKSVPRIYRDKILILTEPWQCETADTILPNVSSTLRYSLRQIDCT